MTKKTILLLIELESIMSRLIEQSYLELELKRLQRRII